MSLINDALKRANNVTPPSPEAETSDLQHASEPESAPPSNIPIILFPVALFVVLGLAAFFLVRGLERKHAKAQPTVQHVAAREAPATTPVVSQHETLQVAATPTSNPPTTKTEPTPEPNLSAATNAVATTLPGAATSPSSPTADAKSSQTRVQAIFYRAKNPAAVINSKTVYVGDAVGDAKVVAIDKQTVTIELNGTRKVLTLF